MKDISALKKKLAGYSAMAGVVLAANNHSAHAQIIYHDIVPDTTLGFYDQDYPLDLNGDGQVDFLLGWRPISNKPLFFYGCILPYHFSSETAVIMQTHAYAHYLEGLNSCQIISANPPGNDAWSMFSTSLAMGASLFSTNSGTLSPWLNNGGDLYAPLKLHLPDGDHYGWIRMTFNPGPNFGDGNMVLKDYAYQTIPDSAITTPCAQQVKDIAAPDLFNAFIDHHQLILHFHQSPLPSQIILFNEVGVKLNEQAITQSELVMDVSHLAAGIYFVVVDDNATRQVKKVIKVQ